MNLMVACDPFSPQVKNLQAQKLQTKAIGFATRESDDAAPPSDKFIAEESHKFELPDSKGSVSGHLANDIDHASYPSSRYEIRTYMPVEGGKVAAVDFQELLKQVRVPSTPSQRYTITSEQIQGAVDQTAAERAERLKNPTVSVGATRVVPKDGSLNPENIDMFVTSSSDVSARYLTEMAAIGEIEGFHMVAGAPSHGGDELAKNLKKAGATNVSIIEHGDGCAWVEDYGEPTLGGGRVACASFNDPSGSFVRDAIREGRVERYKGAGPNGADIVDNNSYHGAVNYRKSQRAHLAEGLAVGDKLTMALSYIEGGNTMTGSLANGEGYALVGSDSFHVTKRLLERETGKKFSDQEVREVIAADFGLKPENVHSIEQPGTFHIDMRLTPIAPGEIMLNDSIAAANQQEVWLTEDLNKRAAAKGWSKDQIATAKRELSEQMEGIREQATAMKILEDKTARELEAAGFKVHRLGGAFVDPNRPTQDNTNFFNARHGTNEDGDRFTVMMGGAPREEAYVATAMLQEFHAPISRIHFLDPVQTRRTLDLQGGLKCRTKPGGELVSGELLTAPKREELALSA